MDIEGFIRLKRNDEYVENYKTCALLLTALCADGLLGSPETLLRVLQGMPLSLSREPSDLWFVGRPIITLTIIIRSRLLLLQMTEIPLNHGSTRFDKPQIQLKIPCQRTSGALQGFF